METLTDYWVLWTYLAGYLWFWRYHVGYILDDFAYGGDSDGVEIAMAMTLGSIVTTAWPFTVFLRGVYVTWVKLDMTERGSSLERFFPGPREIESRWEKKERLEREEREQTRARQREINTRERELGMTPTEWQ